MLLKSLKLENIRSYINEVIVFPKGSVLLSGDIGSGKSTILLAIEFALFGILRSELSGSSLLRNGETKGSVELSFEIDNKTYVIKRTLKKSKDAVTQDSGYIITDDVKFEGTPVELKAKILEILGYPESMLAGSKSLIYRFTVYTAQEQMKEIIFEDTETRLNTLRKVFGIDKYKTVKDNSSILIRELKSKKNEINSRLEKIADIEKNLQEKISKKEASEKEIREYSIELEKENNILSNEKNILLELENKEKEFLQSKKEIEINDREIKEKVAKRDDLTKKISLSSLKSLEIKLSQFLNINTLIDEKPLETALNNVLEEHNLIFGKNAAYDEKTKTLKKRITENELFLNEFETIKKETEKIKSRILENKDILSVREKQEILFEELKDKEKNISIELETIMVKLNNAKSHVDFILNSENCPTCGQIIDKTHKENIGISHEKIINNLETEKSQKHVTLEEIKGESEKILAGLKKFEELEKEIEKQSIELIKFEAKLQELKKIETENSKLKEELNLIEKEKPIDIKEIKEKLSKLKNELANARENNQKFIEKENTLKLIEIEKNSLSEKEAELKEINAGIEKIKTLNDELRIKIKSLEEINGKFILQKQKTEFLESRIKGIEIKLNVKKEEIKNTDERINELKNDLAELSLLKKRLEEIIKLQNWVEDFFIKLMTTIEKHVMISIHREFNMLLKDWLSLLIEDIEISLDDEFSVDIMQNGFSINAEDLSGGEKTSVALAYRLSLNKVVNDLVPNIKTKDLIILDEPTDGFSSEQLDKVRDILKALNMRQTIIVSHEAKMESYVENVIRIEKREGVSIVLT